MTVHDLLARGRAAAEELMTDTVTATRVTGAPGAVNAATGDRAPGASTSIYNGIGKIQTYEPHESARKSGEHVYIEQRYHLHLPISATAVRVGDTITVTASPTDPQLVGRVYRVAGEHSKTWATARRLLLDEITG